MNRCNRMECIWLWSLEDENEELNGSQYQCWLQTLERIEIHECGILYTLFKGIPTPTCPSILPFFSLKELIIMKCHNLKNVISSSWLLQLLQNLEVIIVQHFDELEELIGDDEEEESRNNETPITIPRLKDLKFWNLPKLKRIWRGVMICNSLEMVDIRNCSELKRLPQFKGAEQSTPPTSLKAIEGSREWWDLLEWDPAFPQNILQPFFYEWDPTYASK
ncbi:hypothetical protein AQUCO_05100053v1 [Aquilegia coerulea]|uniref:Disease resistance protein At4g27190-like leucine-rich repeats domain-containing protein n=1 Tax=Aquilegia coerulea TaxID=218851 RepID=A0A2G5CIX6_AQUCA|nr:hypothetical protein AQUCO_05100053v1 [Aquilegia coerulea]